MSTTRDLPDPLRPGSHARAGGRLASLLASLAILAGSVVLGLAGGLVWAALAPRVAYVVVARGSADVVNPETTAFIAADAWYCLIGAAGGLAIGLTGYLLAVRRYGPAPMAAILAGSVAAGVAARWVGVRQGLGKFDNQLLTSHQGTVLHAPLALAGDAAAAVWPTVAAFPALAFWPLTGCGVAGGIILIITMRERRAPQSAARLSGPPQFPSYPAP